ncbi:hypothetical protein LF887_04205 [Chryseobacterium sp. MEBOG06]|uniref:RHS repeat protein n=1 Tax=Chryseobacterium sp. MEBOG06 TaxID=2879938 RepID=UPI001F3A6015|nr:RHS repeat-associated core domain-containing protein [Chryseobacterium sp. MEBOG06]UKB84846.1 hypothetical protein LF887_04205 [Chryseobacterium sp. MEBOG06]
MNSSNFGGLYSYKYNGKELQETGMFDYGWRQYMPDLGRWNGIDQLSESYISTSPYAYVANNPVSQYDVDGRWFNQDGSIDTSGRTPGFTTGRQYYNSFFGINPGDGGGANSMFAAGLIDTAFGLGGTWSNTGFGFMDSDGTLLGYNGSYKSLNVNFEEGGIGEATNYVPEVFVTGRKGGGFFEGSYNSFMMENGMNNARMSWNLSQSRSLLYDAIENTKVGRSVSAAENFMFLELPASLAGGEILAAGWRAAGAGRYLSGVVNKAYANIAPKIVATFSETAEQAVVHGNSLKSLRPTWGYKLYSADGTFLKNGITSKLIPETRYTKTFMSNKVMMEKILFPNRAAAYQWEFQQNQILRGPLNLNMH